MNVCLILNFRWKSHSQIGCKLGFAASKTVSNARRFRKVSDDKMKELKVDQLKKRTFNYIQWATNTYRQWRSHRMSDVGSFDARIYESDLDRVELLEKDSFKFALCNFLAEVRKVDGTEYPGKTLYHLVVSIQKHINTKAKKNWKLVEGSQFSQVRTVLNNLMKERAKNNIGNVKRQAQMIDSEIENKLWESGALGEKSPDQLRWTVLFLIGLNIGLHAGDEHYALRRDAPNLPSQLQFERNLNGTRCVVYREDTTTKMNDGGLAHMRKERKVVWVYPSSNPEQCPVRLIDKYISLLPPLKPTTKKFNFYLRGLEKPTPAQWYGEQVVGLTTIRRTMQDICKKAGIEGFITNHSLRRMGTTKLFVNGVDRKLIKKFTGHVSDAVDAYAIKSDEQREKISNILMNSKKEKQESLNDVQVSVKESKDAGGMACVCNSKKITVNECDKLGSMINQLLENRKGCKATIKVEIEFNQ